LKSERPLNDKEIKILNKQLNQLDKNFRRQIRFLIIWALLALLIGTYAFFKMDTRDEILLLFVTVAVYIGIGVWGFGKEYMKQNQKRKSIAYLKDKGLVTVIEVRSDKYCFLKEQEDEGVYYLFQLDNNKVFSFGGQDFYPNKKFPNDHFEIVEGRGINDEVVLLETFTYGKKIKPTKIIAGQEKWDLLNSLNYPDPYKLTVTDGKIEDFLPVPASSGGL
jgi:hypothetical protein